MMFSMMVLLFLQCKQPIDPIATHPSGLEYAGPESCATCHSQIYDQHLQTAHYSSSSSFGISGKGKLFEQGHNRFRLIKLIPFRIYRICYMHNNQIVRSKYRKKAKSTSKIYN